MEILECIPNNLYLAIHSDGLKKSYSDLHLDTQMLIKNFRKIFNQNKICVWVESRNDYKTILTFIALWQLDHFVVPIDLGKTKQELQLIKGQLKPDCILISDINSDLLSFSDIPIISVNEVFEFEILKHSPHLLSTESKVFSVAHLAQFSSGSTGNSKVILINKSAIRNRADSIKNELQLTNLDRTLCTVPITHSHGIDCLILPTLFAGGQLFMIDHRTAFPNRILHWLDENQITFFSSVPQTYHFINEISEQKKYNLSQLRPAFCGSAALQESVAMKFLEHYKIYLRQGYGLAEVGVITLNLENDIRSLTSIGKVIEGIEWQVQPDGELVVKSESLFVGYLENNEITKSRFVNDFFLTEDLVSVDDQQRLFLIGRKNDIINSSGLKFFPAEVENVVMSFGCIHECAVVCVKDTERGEVAILHAVHNSTNSDSDVETALIKFLQEKISGHKIPKKIHWHRQLPKSPLGKVLKSKLVSL